jgi:hypothetical protein
MVAAPAFSVSNQFSAALDELLLETCEEFQISTARYDLAGERYRALNKLFEGSGSPFRQFRPDIYPQGSMALGTTVQPIKGPHDLDFVLELSNYLRGPMHLITELHEFLSMHGVYGPMTSLKNRCVRIEYADEFYMDVLPACRVATAVGTCIKVPDCALRGWSDSNPRGYIKWFKEQSAKRFVGRLLERAERIPDQQAVTQKDTLQLVVQLFKRWRDRCYASVDPSLAPISIVLTTLAADTYQGEQSVSNAITSMLSGIVNLIDVSRRAGECHLHLCNPSNTAEDLTERWDSNPLAYSEFERGIRDFQQRWMQLVMQGGNVNVQLQSLFGETVTTVLRKRTQKTQDSRLAEKLGVTSAGLITSSTAAAVRARPNTFYGTE